MRYKILGLLRRFGYDIQRYGAYPATRCVGYSKRWIAMV